MLKSRIKEERTCINCGCIWEVTLKKPSKIKSVFCKDCLNKLSKSEKQHIYRLYSGKYVEEERVCLNCGKIWKVEVRKDSTHTKIHHYCDECNNLLSSKDKKQLQRLKLDGYHDREKEQRRRSHKHNIIRAMLSRAKQRALKHGYEFNLTKDDIHIPELCPLLEVPFVLGDKKNYEYTPTIDRIDNSKGYIKGNVWVITKKANSMKNSASHKELTTFCTNMLRYSLNNKEEELIELPDKELVR